MNIVSMLLNIVYFLLLARVIISWLRPDPTNPIVSFIHQMTEPILEPIRRMIPPSGGVDFSPMVLFVIIILLQNFLR